MQNIDTHGFLKLKVHTIFIGCAFIIFLPYLVFAQEAKGGIQADGSGEAAILAGDIPSARLQAIVQDAAIIDDVVKKKVGGSVRDFKVKAEGKKGDVYWVNISASVIPSAAREAIVELARNTSVTVFIPAKFPEGDVEESHPMVEGIINNMASQGYQVHDVADSQHTLTVNQVEQAMKSGNFMAMRGLVYRYLSNVILIGKIDTTVTGRAGDDIGSDMKLPYNVVTARLTYRLIAGKG